VQAVLISGNLVFSPLLSLSLSLSLSKVLYLLSLPFIASFLGHRRRYRPRPGLALPRHASPPSPRLISLVLLVTALLSCDRRRRSRCFALYSRVESSTSRASSASSSPVPEQRTVASHSRPDLPGVPPANRLPHSCNRLHTGGPRPHQVALHRICTTPDQITTKTPPKENMRLWGRHMSKLAARRFTIALIT